MLAQVSEKEIFNALTGLVAPAASAGAPSQTPLEAMLAVVEKRRRGNGTKKRRKAPAKGAAAGGGDAASAASTAAKLA